MPGELSFKFRLKIAELSRLRPCAESKLIAFSDAAPAAPAVLSGDSCAEFCQRLVGVDKPLDDKRVACVLLGPPGNEKSTALYLIPPCEATDEVLSSMPDWRAGDAGFRMLEATGMSSRSLLVGWLRMDVKESSAKTK